MSEIKSRIDYVGKLILSAVADCDGRHDEAILQKCNIAIEKLERIRRNLEKSKTEKRE